MSVVSVLRVSKMVHRASDIYKSIWDWIRVCRILPFDASNRLSISLIICACGIRKVECEVPFEHPA